MASNPGSEGSRPAGGALFDSGRGGNKRLSTETKASFKTSELVAYIVVFIGILIAANVIEGSGDQDSDYFAADKAWLYITLLTIGYMISRGLAKSGSRDPYWDESGNNADR